jgi:hypothetical protein
MKPRATSSSEEYSGDVKSAAFGSRFNVFLQVGAGAPFFEAVVCIEAPNSTRVSARNVKQRKRTRPPRKIGEVTGVSLGWLFSWRPSWHFG